MPDVPETEDVEEGPGKVSEAPPKRSLLANIAWGIFDFLKTVVIIVGIAFAIRAFLIQPFIVEGQSMEPNFENNNYLITEKVSYRLHAPQRGDIIIFHPPGDDEINYIKRVIGVPGDHIQIKSGSVLVNGKKISEPYLESDEQTLVGKSEFSDITLADNQFFLMGDNRNHSRDSREIGVVGKDRIISRIWFRLLPVNEIKAFAHVNYPSN